MLRAVRNRICTEYRSTGDFPMQKGGQCLQALEYRYALVPHAGDWREGEVYGEAMEVNAEIAAFQTAAHDQGEWPPEQSLMSVEPAELVFAGIKQAAERDSMVLRLFNPTAEPVRGRLRLSGAPAGVWPAESE